MAAALERRMGEPLVCEAKHQSCWCGGLSVAVTLAMEEGDGRGRQASKMR